MDNNSHPRVCQFWVSVPTPEAISIVQLDKSLIKNQFQSVLDGEIEDNVLCRVFADEIVSEEDRSTAFLENAFISLLPNAYAVIEALAMENDEAFEYYCNIFSNQILVIKDFSKNAMSNVRHRFAQIDEANFVGYYVEGNILYNPEQKIVTHFIDAALAEFICELANNVPILAAICSIKRTLAHVRESHPIRDTLISTALEDDLRALFPKLEKLLENSSYNYHLNKRILNLPI